MFGKPVQTWVDGKLYFDVELDRERRAAVEAEKQAHLAKLGLAPKAEEDR